MFEIEALNYGYHQTLGISVSEMKQSAYDWQNGAEFGYNKANEWHYPSKGELPECDETKNLWLYFKDYYANDRDCEYPFYRTSIGVYKSSFLNENVKVFAEKTKGYESEILLEDIIAWKEIVLPELKESESC